ncbi:hypothetical protein ECA02_20450 [Enterococcus casseliflavus]|nr:hypothetical protein ECA02_20450 [Enterococcus casseliflavus]
MKRRGTAGNEPSHSLTAVNNVRKHPNAFFPLLNNTTTESKKSEHLSTKKIEKNRENVKLID